MPVDFKRSGANVHIFYVGADNSTHLFPTLFDSQDEAPGFPPKKVHFFALESHRPQVKTLSNILEEKNISVQTNFWRAFPNKEDFIEELELLDLIYEGYLFLANLTNFPVEMIPDILKVAKNLDWALYTFREETDDIRWMRPEQWRGLTDTPDRLKIVYLLAANGWTALNGESARKQEWLADNLQEEKQITQQLLKRSDEFSKPFGQLNYLASQAYLLALRQARARNHRRSRMEIEQNLTNFDSPTIQHLSEPFLELVSLFEQAGYLRFNNKTRKIEFPDDACRFFVNGGWLENHIQHLLRPMTGKKQLIQEAVKGLQIESHSGSHQELDIAFMADNRLHIVECKTSRFKEINNPDNPGSQILYKIDYLRSIGGQPTKGMLASYRYVPEGEIKRAKDMNINLVTGKDLLRLDEILKTWIGT